ncbi:hypothetical protein M2352_001622 [Azospirillum fermentarium]|uniref:hypothetical protein n=1 Tax=Azospirillum fermentarium TaxID=1233114 RepID=UPI0022268AA2|nr:hypothetical protein [Azospirillum fermentarium]MCW2246031.1 hypothetical protein [Azospirillum fermentarium]
MGNTIFVQNYDFSQIENALLKRGKAPEKARAATTHLQAFMTLCAMYPDKTLAAWNLMDDAWHEFIVRTVDYEAFCNTAFGSFLHHNADAFGTSEFSAAWNETVNLAKSHFGLDLVRDESAPHGAMTAAICMIMRLAA